MDRRLVIAASVVVVIAMSGCGNGEEPAGEPGAGQGTVPPIDASPPEQGSIEDLFEGDGEAVATGLEAPWGLAFSDDGDMLVTERPGRVRLVTGGSLADEPVAELDVNATGEAGLLGIALHPGFPDEPWVYLYRTVPDGSNQVSRWRVDPAEGWSFGDEEPLIQGIPGSSTHNGGRIAFGPDDHLYVTTGDAGDPNASADSNGLAGKILRITPEGDEAPGNMQGLVFAYGLRNPQGLAWDAEERLYVADHGPTGEFGLCCRDELNLVESGDFLGWPFRSGGAETGAGEPPEEPIDPVAQSGEDTWAPSGIAHVEVGDESAVLMANLRGEHVRRVSFVPDSPREPDGQGAVLDGLGRVRDVVAHDGCVYVLTSNRDGRGDPRDQDDQVRRYCA